jgi:hypothetical protein
VLFSNNTIANYINAHFEPTWKSLRPVPKVTIDFGNGTVVKRTLNGNIATFVCTADGTVVDVIAGINDPDDYLSLLQQAESAVQALPTRSEQRSKALLTYHVSQTLGESSQPNSLNDFLNADTRVNNDRRRLIHEKLRNLASAKPDDIMHWLYRDLLHADLDDPMLGLKKELFQTYPFDDAVSSVQFADKDP